MTPELSRITCGAAFRLIPDATMRAISSSRAGEAADVLVIQSRRSRADVLVIESRRSRGAAQRGEGSPNCAGQNR